MPDLASAEHLFNLTKWRTTWRQAITVMERGQTLARQPRRTAKIPAFHFVDNPCAGVNIQLAAITT